jgi:cell division protein FtsQ
MKIERHIRKMLLFGFWLAIAAGVLVLVVAAMKERKEDTCKGYSIDIKGAGEKWFIDKKDVVDLLMVQGVIKGRSLKRFDLRGMEDRLQKNPWIKNAELFFDNNQVLQVKIEEREPVARVFMVNGSSFYIDSTGERLPLSDKFSARLPVFTGFPVMGKKLNSADSLFVKQVAQVGGYLLQNQFWMAQVAQVDILPARTFEMIPVIGNHVIEFGDGADCDKKFNRLMIFYRQVLSKTGMDRYARVNVQYAGQVVGVKTNQNNNN